MEVPFPFEAFLPDLDAPDVEVIAAEIDAGRPPARPDRSAARPPAQAPVVASAGRVVVAVGGPGVTGEASLHRISSWLAHGGEVDPLAFDRRTATDHDPAHHDPADLAFWADVDAACGRVATALDVVLCSHHAAGLEQPDVLSVDGPGHLRPLLEAAADRALHATERAVLTDRGQVLGPGAGTAIGAAVRAHAHRTGGRAEMFPGQHLLRHDLPVADVVGHTAIDRVESIHGPFSQRAVLRAHGFVRPHYVAGALVLSVGHDNPREVVPWEVRYCRPCCGAAHD